MKKGLYILGATVVALLVVSGLLSSPILAAKPDSNKAGAEKYGWHLSGDVMPVPPYGSMDIPGSDEASKLIVNQPNGEVVTNLTGVMKGLHPNTLYTVYLSKGYEPFVIVGWRVAGTWGIDVEYMGTDYAEVLVLSQDGDQINGGSLALVGGGSPWTIDTGEVDGNNIEFQGYFNSNPSMLVKFMGVIDTDGTMGGTWEDIGGLGRDGTWETTSGRAINHTGDMGWPGFVTPEISAFTFMTDEEGNGSWHYNFKEVELTEISVWINEAGRTILISDSVEL